MVVLALVVRMSYVAIGQHGTSPEAPVTQEIKVGKSELPDGTEAGAMVLLVIALKADLSSHHQKCARPMEVFCSCLSLQRMNDALTQQSKSRFTKQHPFTE